MLLLLTMKDGKVWPKKHVGGGKYEYLSETERDLWAKEEREIFEKKWAEALNHDH